MIKILVVLTGLSTSLVASEPPTYGSSSDGFDINSISSYLDDDGNAPTSSSLKGLGSGSYSYSSFSGPSPSSLPYKAPTQPSYLSQPGSTAATSVHPSFGGVDGSSTFYSPPSYSSNGSPSFSSEVSYSSQPTSQYETHVSFGGNAGSYSTSYKGDRPSTGGFSFPESSAEAHSSNDDVRSTAPAFGSAISSSPNHNTGNYKKYTSFGSPSQGSSYKDSYNQGSAYNNEGSNFASSFGGGFPQYSSNASPLGSSTSPFAPYAGHSSPFEGGTQSSHFGSDFNTRPFMAFGSSGSDGFPGDVPGRPYQWGRPNPNAFPGDDNYRGPAYNDGPGPYMKDFASYKGPQADLPYSPNSFGPRPHTPYSGGNGGGRPTYRGKHSGGKGSRYPRHPRPSYSPGHRGYSGRPHSGPRYPPSYRSGSKSPKSGRY